MITDNQFELMGVAVGQVASLRGVIKSKDTLSGNFAMKI
jgi:hypothetical protein